jgi:ABC-2 type transport system ATP-binding protein
MNDEQSARPESRDAVRASDLSRRFGDTLAVDRLNLGIAAGSFFGLIGSNGAGKSTTLKMLTTLLRPSAGSAQVAGFDIVREARQVRRLIGYVPQLLSADATLTGRENLRLFAKLYDVPRSERDARVDQALAFMQLGDAASRLVRTYSGGMIRRLEIAQALLHHPRVVFLDEPTVGLDPRARFAVWDTLRELRAEFGSTVLLTTHDMEEADVLCEHVAIMHLGRLVALGAPSELKAQIGPDATMDDVFVQFTGGPVERSGSYRDVARMRRTARRLG